MQDSFLLDTHAFLWAIEGNSQLSKRVRGLFASANTLLVSVASIWEIALKNDKGKLDASAAVIDEAMEQYGLVELPVRTAHVRLSSSLPKSASHKDPFDRLIVAQAISEQIPLVTNDASLRREYRGVEFVW